MIFIMFGNHPLTRDNKFSVYANREQHFVYKICKCVSSIIPLWEQLAAVSAQGWSMGFVLHRNFQRNHIGRCLLRPGDISKPDEGEGFYIGLSIDIIGAAGAV